MPSLYLSPSLQQNNPYIIGGSEEEYMNLVADAMEPYLRSSGIRFTRNDPEMTLSQVIAQSNAGKYDLHLALHSNASPESLSGELRGTDAYYYDNSSAGQKAATIIANNFKEISPTPDRVRPVGTTTLAEVVRTKAPSVLVEIAYHDNVEDAEWIRDNIQPIARNLVMSLADYFNIPFIEPQPVRQGTVDTVRGNLNLRGRPSLQGDVLAEIPDGAQVTVYGESGGWYVVEYKGTLGYASSQYIDITG